MARLIIRVEAGRLPEAWAFALLFDLRLVERSASNRGGSTVPRIGKCMAERADQKPAHETGVAETDLGFGRMDIYVDRFRVQIHKQRRHRVAVAREEILIGGADDAGEELVLYRTAIHEEILMLGIAAIERRKPRKPGNTNAFFLSVDLHGVLTEVPAHDCAETSQARLFRRAALRLQAEDRTAILGEFKADFMNFRRAGVA